MLNYYYNKGTNQLNHVTDAVAAGNYPNDIDNEHLNNYHYNAIGQLDYDDSCKIDTITWTIYGKVQTISFAEANDSNKTIEYKYDPLGNRIEKITIMSPICLHPPCITNTNRYDTVIYSRDAQGNILAVYDRQRDSVWLNEWDIYGSKRIGVVDTTLFVGTQVYACSCSPLSNPLDSITWGYLEGQKQYELTNHLGNVLVTINDKKLPIDTTGTPNLANYYVADVINAQDYYPFGMVEPGRTYTVYHGDTLYRFGYQGSLRDDDIYGKDNAYTTKNRELDDRLARWWSLDPVANSSWSPYVSMNDNPEWENDILGDVVDGTTKGKKEYKAYRDENNKRIKTTEDRLGKLNKDDKDYKKKYTQLSNALNQYKEINTELDGLEHDQKNLYYISTDVDLGSIKTSATDKEANGATYYQGETNNGMHQINIDLASDAEIAIMGNLSHELKHAYQYYSGFLGLSKIDHSALYHDKFEPAAYERDAIFNSSYDSQLQKVPSDGPNDYSIKAILNPSGAVNLLRREYPKYLFNDPNKK